MKPLLPYLSLQFLKRLHQKARQTPQFSAVFGFRERFRFLSRLGETKAVRCSAVELYVDFLRDPILPQVTQGIFVAT